MSQPAPLPQPWWARAYRLALRAFPNEFRDRWGEDMILAFTDRVNDASRTHHSTARRIISRELRNVLADGFRERLHSSTPISDMLHAQDIRYAFRLLARSPGFALLTILVLAGGLGLSTFTFSFLYTAMMRPLPLRDGDRIVRFMQAAGDRRMPLDVVDVSTLRSSMKSVRDIGGYTGRDVIVGREGDRRVLDATITDPVLFSVARTRPFLGRALLPSDAEPGAEPVIVLAHRAWRVAFGEDRSIVNALVAIDGVSTRVVGVMPEGFGFPIVQDVWMPLSRSLTTQTRPGSAFVQVFARLTPRATQAQAAAEASSLLRAGMIARDSTASAVARYAVAVESFPAAQLGEERTLMFTLLNLLAALILLLALVNVTTLITARANERVRETAVRLALGAPRARLVMQGMWEGVVLCVLAGVLGTAGAAWGLDTVTAWTHANIPGNMAFWWVWQLDRITLVGAGAFVTFAIVVLGSVVSLHTMRTNVREVMQDGSARSGSRREGRVVRSLVATQVMAVTVIMFVGVLSGVMASRVVHMDPGYDPTNLLQVDLSPSPERFKTDDARAAIFRNVEARLGEHPAVDGVLLRARLGEPRSDRGELVVRDAAPLPTLPSANIVATLGSLSTLGIDLVSGRLLATSDDATRSPVALVSRSLASRLWGVESPIGKQLRFAGVGDTLQWRTVVGVVSDMLYGDPFARDRSTDAMYVPLLQAGAPDVFVFLRHRGSEVAGRQALNDVFGAVDPLLVPGTVFRASETIEKSGLIARGMTKLFGGCFIFALLLAVVGTYGLMSRSIGLRTREIGVRRALGATDSVAARMLLGQGARQLGVGTLIAAPILIVIGVATTSYLPLGAAVAAVSGVVVSVAIIAAVLAATWLPTRKVLRVPLRDALWRE